MKKSTSRPKMLSRVSRVPRASFISDELQSVASSLQSSSSNARSYINFVKIGEGGFSDVYKAQKLESKITVAIKKIKVCSWKRKFLPKFMKSKTIHSERTGMLVDEVLEEVQTLRLLQGDAFVITFFDSFKAAGEYWVVTEFTLGDLHSVMKNSKLLPINSRRKRHFPLNLIQHLLSPIFSALAHMHKLCLIHRDIKEDNCLLTSKGIPKLADFGSAKTFDPSSLPLAYSKKGPIGSFFYMSPEILKGEAYFPNTDSWSLGVTFLSMLQGEQPFCQVVPFNLLRLQEFLSTKAEDLDKAHAKNPKRVSAQERFYRISSLTKLESNVSTFGNNWLEVGELLKKMLVLDKNTRSHISDIIEEEEWIKDKLRNWTNYVANNVTGNEEDSEVMKTSVGVIDKLNISESWRKDHEFVMKLVQELQLKDV